MFFSYYNNKNVHIFYSSNNQTWHLIKDCIKHKGIIDITYKSIINQTHLTDK